MLQIPQGFDKGPSIDEDYPVIQTTLYDLVEAVNESVKPDDDQFVAQVVVDLLKAGRAQYENTYH